MSNVNKLTDRFLLITIILSLALRISLLFIPGFKIDMDAWAAWAYRLNQLGFSNFYSDQIWTNYTPGYLYILWFLGLMKNLFNFSNETFYLLLKIPSMLAEITLAIFVYKILKKTIWAKISLLLIVFNPAFIFNSAVWGQIDGLLTLALVLSIYYLAQKRILVSSIFLGLGILLKPQALLLVPVFLLYILKNFSLKNIVQISLGLTSTILLLCLPFFPNPFGIFNLAYQMISDYTYSSLFAYNLWGATVGFWIQDSTTWNNLSYKHLGLFLLFIYWIILTFLYLKNKLSLFALSLLSALGFFFLPTRIHERYLYPALLLLIIIAAQLKSKLLLTMGIILSLIHLLNLYYVYIYFNVVYLKTDSIIENKYLYNLLEKNGQSLSLISTVCFLLIFILIINYESKTKSH